MKRSSLPILTQPSSFCKARPGKNIQDFLGSSKAWKIPTFLTTQHNPEPKVRYLKQLQAQKIEPVFLFDVWGLEAIEKCRVFAGFCLEFNLWELKESTSRHELVANRRDHKPPEPDSLFQKSRAQNLKPQARKFWVRFSFKRWCSQLKATGLPN